VTALTPTPDTPGSSRTSAPTSATELEHHFAAGMQLFKAGKDAEAAHELGTAADAPGNEALAADARYFQAVALTRASRKAEAEAALLAFLDHAPHSMRRGRAEVMLARLIADRGDSSSAKRWFELATRDADPAIVAAAKAGLAKLAP
jgi:TolA-binding protein